LFKPRFLTLALFWGSPSGRFSGIYVENVFSKILAKTKKQRFSMCFGVSRFFCSKHDFRLDPCFCARRLAVFRDFRGKRVFQNSGRCEKPCICLCFGVSRICFQNTIFDLTPVFALAVGPFSGLFVENVFFKILTQAKTQRICLCFGVCRIFVSRHEFRLSPRFCARRRAVLLYCIDNM